MVRKHDQSTSPVDTEEQDPDVTSSAAASTAEQDENLDSSPESDPVESEESLLDAIEKAANSEDEPETSEPAADEESEGSDNAEGDEESDTRDETDRKEPEEEDDGSDVEEGQRIPYQRFKKVIDQRNEIKGQLKTLAQERDQYREGHQQHAALQSYMKENNIATEDAVQALEIAALINTDPARAIEALRPTMQTLQQYVGEVLPEDLQERVDMGELSERDAQEMVRTRNENSRLQKQQAHAQQTQSHQRQQEQVRATQESMANAADQMQARISKADPDYSKKAPWVRKELQLLIQSRNPRSADDAAKLVQEAYDNVTRELGKLASKPQVRPGPSSTEGRGSTHAGREPSSMSEAIARAAGLPAE